VRVSERQQLASINRSLRPERNRHLPLRPQHTTYYNTIQYNIIYYNRQAIIPPGNSPIGSDNQTSPSTLAKLTSRNKNDPRMDRGRAGGFITDNNYMGLQFKRKMRREHLDRLEKIKTRKPGSSVTLDNNPPVIIKAMLSNPRKHAVKDYFNFVTECENK
jgi:hypothetical protein